MTISFKFQVSRGKRKEERGKRKEERGRRKEEGGKRKEEGAKGKGDLDLVFGVIQLSKKLCLKLET